MTESYVSRASAESGAIRKADRLELSVHIFPDDPAHPERSWSVGVWSAGKPGAVEILPLTWHSCKACDPNGDNLRRPTRKE